MDIGENRWRVIARAVTIAFLAGLVGACADQNSGPAPVYLKSGAPAPASASALPPSPPPSPRYVTVQEGQSVDRIAHRYHVPVSAIVAANGLKPPYKLRPGARLLLPNMGPPPPVRQAAEYSRPSPPQTAAAAPTPLPPQRPETLTPPQNVAATPTAPSAAAAPPAAMAKTEPEVIPLDGPPPKQIVGAQHPPPVVGVMPPPAAAPSASAPPGAPPVLPPRNAAAALPLPGEAPVDWGSAAAAQAAASGRFPWPVRGRILANYGSTVGGGRNDGINIAAPLGTPVRAIDSGIVAYAGNEVKGYGNLVLIRHANGWISAYAHLDALSVKVGDKIAAGQVFARVGSSGGVGEPQLHFELRRGKKPVDPREFLAPAPSAGQPPGDKAG